MNVQLTLDVALLAFPPTASTTPAIVIVTFNWAIWYNRVCYFATLATPPPLLTAAQHLAEFALDRTRLPGIKPVSTSPAIARLAKDPPRAAIFAFTDGSAAPNPGPTGAGLWVSLPDTPAGPGVEVEISAALGLANNNVGEMAALELAVRTAAGALRALPFLAPPDVLFFTDSMLSLGHIVHGWTFDADLALGYRARSGFHSLTQTARTRLYWVRGHSGVPGNVRADTAAGAASKLSATLAPHAPAPLPTLTLCYHGGGRVSPAELAARPDLVSLLALLPAHSVVQPDSG